MTTLEPVVSITTALELLSTTPSTAPTPTPAINPLLSRTKPKRPKSKKNSSKASTITLKNLASIDATIASTLDTEEAIDGEGEETDVLDLLDQLDAQRAAEKQAIVDDQFNNAIEDTFDVNKEIKVGRTRESRESVSSVSSGKSAREFLHNFKEDIKERLHMNGSSSSNSNGEKKVSRQQARKIRNQMQMDQIRTNALAEVEAENDNSIGEERKAIDDGCIKLGVVVKEIEPDGHCLYGAIADQVNYLKLSTLADSKESYVTIRQAAGIYMRAHPDEFLPFLESEENDGLMTPENYARYCDMVQNTAEWGGHHEIMALSKHYNSPIHVLQAGTDLVKVGEDITSGRGPMLISYHRKMYGLGEHYNSLRPAASMHPSEILSIDSTV